MNKHREWIIRHEIPSDIDDIYQVNLSAFETPVEAELVNRIRTERVSMISLVARYEKKTIGHILFTPAEIHNQGATLIIAALGPMAVMPAYQNMGVGSELVRQGIAECRVAGYQAIAVLGHPSFYPRFGFRPSTVFGITCEYEVPEEAFMIMELIPDSLSDISGILKYHVAFYEAT